MKIRGSTIRLCQNFHPAISEDSVMSQFEKNDCMNLIFQEDEDYIMFVLLKVLLDEKYNLHSIYSFQNRFCIVCSEILSIFLVKHANMRCIALTWKQMVLGLNIFFSSNNRLYSLRTSINQLNILNFIDQKCRLVIYQSLHDIFFINQIH